MKLIIAPVNPDSPGLDTANLQDGLLLLLEKGHLPIDPAEQPFFAERLRQEQQAQRYASTTRKLVSLFQDQHQLGGDGMVDEHTAEVLNRALAELGAFEQPSQSVERPRLVSGRVSREDGQPFARGQVRAFHEETRGTIRLGEDTTDTEGRYTIRYEMLPDVNEINLRVSVLDEAGAAVQSSEVVSRAGSLEVIDLIVPFVQPAAATRQVEGRIVFDHGAPAEGLTLRLYRLGFGGPESAALLAETTTLDHGLYSLVYTIDNQPTNLEVRALDAAGKEITLSKIIKNAAEKEVLNLVAPGEAQPLAAEFARLTGDLLPHVGDLSRLATARENADRQDLTLLHEATGWDARLIALAATATSLTAEAETGLPEDALYGLLRAGLPSDRLQLARVSGEAFDQALNKARASGIVNLDDVQVVQMKQAFENFSVNTRLAVPAPGSTATYGDLLRNLDLSENDQQVFARLYLNHRGDAPSLWQQAASAGLGDAIPKLQKQGKLAFLTTNNPDLTVKLQSDLGEAGPEQLVQMGLYKKEQWLDLIDKIPPAYAGAENPKEAYAEDMARKVRISYTTEVTWHMIETEELQIEGGNANLSTFLKNAISQGFKLGQTPIDAFIKANPAVFDGIAADDQATTAQMVKTLQRVYQITPGNDAMKVLLNEGLLSAQDVLAYPLDVFLERFGPLFPSFEQARLVYRKAEQVSNLTYSLFTLANELDSAPPVFAMSSPAEVRQAAKTELIKHFPTMESLFGSLDFCECEHCRSVLSPAAYLVDLLQFLDREPKIWENTLKDWENKHGDAPYPFKNKAAFDAFIAKWHSDHPTELDPNTKRTPYEILIERRPDLPHIQLTCENTNTALPQIDLVNEILEYYVANKTLKAEAARDTGEATKAELLAEPQYVIAEAYTALHQAHFPLGLPFDLWIETVRQFCAYFDIPLWRVLETLRRSDDLFAPAEVYDRAVVFMESLGLSPGEIALYTNPNPLPTWFELYGFAKEADALTEAVTDDTGQRIDLNAAKALSRRLGVSYKELVEIVSTGFVNPTLETLVTLRKLAVETTDVFFYQQHQHLLNEDETTLTPPDRQRLAEVKAFEQQLDALTEKYKEAAPGFNARTWLQNALQNKAFDTILVLADPDAGCNFDKTTLRYANGDKADALAFLKINLFVRLWRRLGWSIEETDRALQAFVPTNAPFDQNNLSKAPLKTALIYLAHLKALEVRVQLGKETRLKLLTLWTPLPATGKNPLYSQLFLKRSILKSDPIFDHPLGQYLSETNILLKDHLLALQGALGLTAGEIGDILQDNKQDITTARLLFDNVSLLYRYALLARALRLSVADLIRLKEMTGLDPFQPLPPDPLVDTPEGVEPPKKAIEFDYPFRQTLRFIELAEEVKQSGLKIEDLDYLLRHRFDPAGKYRQNAEAMMALTKTLAGSIAAIRAEHTLPADPGASSDETLRQKLGLVLPPAVVERFWAMMNGTAEFTVTKLGVTPPDQLQPGSFMGELAIGQVAYNAPKQEQKLVFRGVLFDGQKTELKDKFFPSLTAGQQTTFAALLDAAQVEARKQADEFFIKHLKEQPLTAAATTGFLQAADFDKLFQPLPAIKDNLTEEQKKAAVKANEEKLREKRACLATTFLPFLQQQLVRQLVVQTLAAATGAEAALVESLLVDKNLLADPSQNTQPLLDAFIAVAEHGLSAAFFAAADGTDPPLASLNLADADTTLQDSAGSPLKPPGTNSARLDGYLEVPAAGVYRFYLTLSKKDTEAELRFDHLPAPVFAGTAVQDNDELGTGANEFVELKPGLPYRFTLNLHHLNGGEAQLLVQGETLPKDRLARLTLYSTASVERSRRAQVLLAKVLQLMPTLGLNERELRYILAHPEDFDGLSLSELPTRESDDTPAQAIKLFRQWRRLAAYASLKNELAGGGEDLIDVFEAATPDDACTRIAHIIRRDPAGVKAAAEVLFTAPKFANEQNVQRLWQVLQLVETFGVPVEALAGWTKIARAPVTPGDHKQRAAIARDLKETIKARFEQETWLRVAQPISDRLRQRQRDALVAHVMHQPHFDRLEQLFEYFLIDPGVEPVVQTSRIRTAIGAVQIFIHRCLLNLEPWVAPAVINSKQWQWMKRYPVWAGNRKLFVFPENVLEPEFRDDKTHLFTELEGKLLQGDVSNDLVEDAFFNYLKKLDELARLDIVGMYCEEQPLDPASNQLHVIGRTYAAEPHKYFYRRYAHQVWTPWEPLPAEIPGDHIVPVVWRDRLNLFWVTFMDKADPVSGPSDDKVLMTEMQMKNFTTTLQKSELLIGGSTSVGKNSSELKSKPAMELTLGQLAQGVRAAMSRKLVTVQLYWSEYFQGEWSVRESGGFSAALTAWVPLDFDSAAVFIHATKDFENGEERAVKIHLGGAINQAFRVVSRNSRPEPASRQAAPGMPYNAPRVQANRYAGNGAFKITFVDRIETIDGNASKPSLPTAHDILKQGGGFTLLPCANTITLGTPEIAALVTPVFYQDNQSNTFFIEPTFKEKTIEEWQEWVTRTPEPEVDWDLPDWWKNLPLEPMLPKYKLPKTVHPDDPIWRPEIDPRARFELASKQDWLANPATAVQFEGELIGPLGRAGVAVQDSFEAAGTAPAININAGSAIAPDRTVVAVETNALASAGLTTGTGGLNVVGSNGLNSALLKNVNTLKKF